MYGWNSSPERVLGVFITADEIFLAELEKREPAGHFYLRQARREKARISGAAWDSMESLADELMRLCMTYGLSYDKISVCLPRELFFIYDREFPAMDRRELTEAVRWDLESNVPFPEGSYWTGFGRHDNQLELAALPKEYGSRLMDALAAAGFGPEALSMAPLRFTCRREGIRFLWRDAVIELSAPAAQENWTEPMMTALYAALRSYYPKTGIEFLPAGERAETARLWQRAGNAVLACALFGMLLFFAGGRWEISGADSQMEDLRQEYSLKARERETMERISGGISEFRKGEQILEALSKERVSWYGVFSVLGDSPPEGVYLTEYDVQKDGVLLCGGRALDYAQLVTYMEQLEHQGGILREKPVLKESSADDRGGIKFKLQLRF